MYGVIVKNRYYRDGGSDYVIRRLCEEFMSLGVEIALADMFEFFHCSKLPDFSVFLDKDWVFARRLEKKGIRVFDSSDAVRICDDKYLTYVELDDEIETPTTICTPLEYSASATGDRDFLESVARLGFPLVAKSAVGSLGSQVHLLKDMDSLEKFRAERVAGDRILYQEFIESSFGKDVRVYTVGGKAVACVGRENTKSFKSNAESGAVTVARKLTKEFKDAAEKVSGILKLDYAAVDFFDTEHPILNEVNSNAYFKEAESASGVNIARAYAEYILEEMQCAKKFRR